MTRQSIDGSSMIACLLSCHGTWRSLHRFRRHCGWHNRSWFCRWRCLNSRCRRRIDTRLLELREARQRQLECRRDRKTSWCRDERVERSLIVVVKDVQEDADRQKNRGILIGYLYFSNTRALATSHETSRNRAAKTEQWLPGPSSFKPSPNQT